MIAILDYGAGNQTSVLRALKSMKIEAAITSDPSVLQTASGLIFPGVGAAGQAMGRLKETGLDKVLLDLAGRIPLLGICLGCQILLENSEEDGGIFTLGLIKGASRRFSPAFKDETAAPIRIPHMGWNDVVPLVDNPLFYGLEKGAQFYFVHGYYPDPAENKVLAQTSYGLKFASFFGSDGLWAAQFHPEKSGPPGLTLLKNFYNYCQTRK